jgi:hypothetical protein
MILEKKKKKVVVVVVKELPAVAFVAHFFRVVMAILAVVVITWRWHLYCQ